MREIISLKTLWGYLPLISNNISNEIRSKGAEYRFMTGNTDAEDKTGTHWWSFLHIEENDSIFLFDSFGTLGLLNIIVKSNKLIFNKVIKGMKNIFMKDNKISMLKWTFQRNKYLKLTQKELNQLSDTAFYFFRFLDEFAKSKDIKINVYV